MHRLGNPGGEPNSIFGRGCHGDVILWLWLTVRHGIDGP
jgi:hypothetical protein